MSYFEQFYVSACQLETSLDQILSRTNIITVCNYGGGRSPEACYQLFLLGYDSVYLSCGLLGLSDFSQDYRNSTIARLKAFQGLYIFLYELEVIKHQKLLKQLGDYQLFSNDKEFIHKVKTKQLLLP